MLEHVASLDESLVAKRKNHVGRTVEQFWIFGVYDTDRKIGAFELIPDRTQATLFPLIRKYVKIPLIRKYVLPGSIIYSDRAAMYVNNNAGIDPPPSHITRRIQVNPPYVHESVNHKENFIDPTSGACTNGVELLWKNAKMKLKAMSGTTRERLPSYLDEFQWRQVYGKKTIEAFDNILEQISLFYPVNN